MKLEFNLVSTNNIYGTVFGLISRSRPIKDYSESSESEVLDDIMIFLADNIEVIDTMVADKSIVNLIQNKRPITLVDLMSMKYLLSTSKIDLLVYGVSEGEVNALDIDAEEVEYNIIDKTITTQSFIPLVNKFQAPSEGLPLDSLYERIMNSYSLFNEDLFDTNPIKTNIQSLRQIKDLSGALSANIINMINSTLSYLGKEIVIITPS